jgi:hypothetical protein
MEEEEEMLQPVTGRFDATEMEAVVAPNGEEEDLGDGISDQIGTAAMEEEEEMLQPVTGRIQATETETAADVGPIDATMADSVDLSAPDDIGGFGSGAGEVTIDGAEGEPDAIVAATEASEQLFAEPADEFIHPTDDQADNPGDDPEYDADGGFVGDAIESVSDFVEDAVETVTDFVDDLLDGE